MWLESRPQPYVLAVSGKEDVWQGWPQPQVKTRLASLPAEGWTRLSAGDGAKGPRWCDWHWRPLAAPMLAGPAQSEHPDRADCRCGLCSGSHAPGAL
jgi:hypothetical protein